jgi:hypothetical protein
MRSRPVVPRVAERCLRAARWRSAGNRTFFTGKSPKIIAYASKMSNNRWLLAGKNGTCWEK